MAPQPRRADNYSSVWATPSGSGSRGARIDTSCAVVSAPTLDRAFARFVQRNRALLAERPTWLFSSGPVGTDTVDKDGRDLLEASVPKEFAGLRAAIHPRGEKVFFGARNPAAKPIGLAERLVALMPAAKDALPKGDFRDWRAIDAWADEIATALS